MKIDSEKKKVFGDIYSNNHWGDTDSKSGPGSNIHQTAVLRKALPGFFLKHQIKSVLDIPCGDFYWMKEIKGDLSKVLDTYLGGDIVPEIISSDNASFADSNFSFRLLDITVSELPSVDLIFCRDCLVHFSYQDIYLALRAIKKSKSKYLLTTTFTNSNRKNINMHTGGWRPLNFQRFPFFFPAPLDLVVEECSENGDIYRDKSLGLWDVKGINLYFLFLRVTAGKIRNGIKKIR